MIDENLTICRECGNYMPPYEPIWHIHGKPQVYRDCAASELVKIDLVNGDKWFRPAKDINDGKCPFYVAKIDSSLPDGSVVSPKLADGAVTNYKIADHTVEDLDFVKAMTSGIDDSHIPDGSVTMLRIAGRNKLERIWNALKLIWRA